MLFFFFPQQFFFVVLTEILNYLLGRLRQVGVSLRKEVSPSKTF